MDSGDNAPPELDGFSLILPLPYRIAVVLVAGAWGWGFNLHYLSAVKIDVPGIIRYQSRPPGSNASVYRSTYHLATLLSVPLAVSLLLFWAITHGDAARVLSWEILPQSYLFLFAVLIALPFHRLSRTGRSRFLVTLKRISVGGLAETQDGKFGDIILADVFTSYAKVFGDLFVSACMFFSRGVSSTGIPDRHCGGNVIVPLLICVPSIIRLRQCLIEFIRVRRSDRPADGWGGQHLANALKYASTFPVIILTALQQNYTKDQPHTISEAGLYRLWVLCACINSMFTFYWDVAKDWDLTLFSAIADFLNRRYFHSDHDDNDNNNNNTIDRHFRHDPEYNHAFGLRAHCYFREPGIYYAAIFIDLILRFMWLSRLSTRINWINDLESGVFVLMFLEVIRRWIWIFFRVETEWVRHTTGPAPDDILLGDFNKRDED